MVNEIKSMFAAIGDRNQRIAEASRKAITEGEALAKLAAAWPVNRPVSNLYYSGTLRELGDIHVTTIVGTREEALDYLDAFTLVPLTYYSGHGISTIRATAWLSEKKAEKYENEISDIYPVFWRFGDYAKPFLMAYTMLGDLRVALKVEITNDPARRTVRPLYDNHDRRVGTEWTLSNAPGGTPIKFSSGNEIVAGEVYIYFEREPGGAALTVRDFMLNAERQQNVVSRR